MPKHCRGFCGTFVGKYTEKNTNKITFCKMQCKPFYEDTFEFMLPPNKQQQINQT